MVSIFPDLCSFYSFHSSILINACVCLCELGIKSQCNTIWVHTLGAPLLYMHRCVVSCRVAVDSSSSFRSLSQEKRLSVRVCASARSFFIYLFIYRFWSLYAYTQHIHYGEMALTIVITKCLTIRFDFLSNDPFSMLICLICYLYEFHARWLMWCVFMCHI